MGILLFVKQNTLRFDCSYNKIYISHSLCTQIWVELVFPLPPNPPSLDTEHLFHVNGKRPYGIGRNGSYDKWMHFSFMAPSLATPQTIAVLISQCNICCLEVVRPEYVRRCQLEDNRSELNK